MLSLAALLLLYMSAPTPAAAQDDLDPMVARQATRFQRQVRSPSGGQMQVTGARGEGRTLIMNVALPADTPESIGPSQAATLFASALCERERGTPFFSNGRVLRLNGFRAGRALGSASVDRCPGPAGTLAASMQAAVGRETGGVTVTSVRTEGNTVIVTLAFPAGTPAASASPGFVEGFCRGRAARTAFSTGEVILRVDTRIGGGDPVPGPPVTACPPAVDPLVARAARRLAWSDTGVFRNVTLRGEGRTLVVAAEIVPGWTGPVLPADLAPAIANTICAGSFGTAFFTEGRALRVEIRPVGGPSTSATVDHCTVPAGQSLTAAEVAASALQPLVGTGEDGVTFTAVRAEGETVVLVMDGRAGWRRRGTIAEMERVMVRGLCGPAAANSAPSNGTLRFRIDTLEGGRDPVQGRPIASCAAR